MHVARKKASGFSRHNARFYGAVHQDSWEKFHFGICLMGPLAGRAWAARCFDALQAGNGVVFDIWLGAGRGSLVEFGEVVSGANLVRSTANGVRPTRRLFALSIDLLNVQ